MQEIGVGRKWRLAALVLGDRDLILLGKLQQRLARLEIPFAPRRDDLHVGLERIIGKLEPHLVVALAGRAVGDRIGADLLGDLDLLLGDQRPRDRGAEQILALIERIGAEHRKHVVADEFLAQILDEDVLRLDAERQRLRPRRLELLALAEIGRERDDLAAISRLQPFENDRRIEPAGIGQHDFLDVFFAARGHGENLSLKAAWPPEMRADYRGAAGGRKRWDAQVALPFRPLSRRANAPSFSPASVSRREAAASSMRVAGQR